MRYIEFKVKLKDDGNEIIVTKDGILDLAEAIKDEIYDLNDDAIEDVFYEIKENV